MQSRNKAAILVFAFVILFSVLSDAQESKIILDPGIKELTINHPSYLRDNSGHSSFAQVSAPAFSGRFSDKPNEMDNACFWLKFQIENKSAQPGSWIVEFDKWQYVDLYLKDSTGKVCKKATGRFVPFKDRNFPLADRSLIQVDLKGGQKMVCYARLSSDKRDEMAPDDLSFTIYEKSALQKDQGVKLNLIFFFCGIYLIMLLYNLFIYFSIKEKGYLYYIGILIFLFFALLNNSGYTVQLFKGIASYPFWFPRIDIICSILFGTLILLFTKEFLRLKENLPVLNKAFNFTIGCLYLLLIPTLTGNLVLANNISSILGLITMVVVLMAAIQSYRRNYPSAFLFLLANGIFVTGVGFFLLKEMGILPVNIVTTFMMEIGSSIEAALFSLALANRVNILKQQNELNQQKIINQLNQYNELQVKVNLELEEKVEARTSELRESQKQLLQKEKLAALGELTAGIAHEIQNPLNFVNNFTEVNAELVGEMEEELAAGNYPDARAIANDIKENIKKVLHHGRRAADIVKGMLMHSGAGSGNKEYVNINTLADENLKVSYHAQRAKDKTFQSVIQTDYDKEMIETLLISQEFGKMLLSIFNNAFYAIAAKRRLNQGNYEPIISVTTIKTENEIKITIKDNGIGIPVKILDKIFQPFYTTKPTGEGTGLGLSLSYDTIKAHGGNIAVNSEEGQFTEFIISLPVVQMVV